MDLIPLVKFSGWTGSALMVVTSFLSNWDGRQALAILGLAFLTIQAYHLKAKNLVVLNILSILGFLYGIYSATIAS